ncbi:MAG: response regulator transcription factor [Bacteroidota bacterium]|nr:response regulator transcription factor [Bacteroidota bacterium]MDP4191220.1 response regulator transcription factor [Bacteroidota bacterium]MDP4196135.1 response regulator transcription factor [Bacteroidota bacterium]
MINEIMVGPQAFPSRNYKLHTNSIRVFISDDSPVVRTRLANMISDIEGISLIGEATNVEDSIKKIDELKPNAVILDICMPGGSGIDVLKEIKKRHPSVIVIVLTNYPFPQYRKICLDAGADYFFDKSNDFYRIIDIFKNLASYPN